jgi:YgiT-type zinc finger domain-containing protein
MKCVICHVGETKPGLASEYFERDGKGVVVRGIPAEVCQTCGESYTDELTAERVEELVEDALKNGPDVALRQYKAA